MNICLATYESIGILKGGPHTQVLQTKRCLEQMGVNVTLFHSWDEFRTDRTDLVHVFGAHIGTYHLVREIHKLGVPLVVSPIFFTRRSPTVIRSVVLLQRFASKFARGLWADYGITRDICRWAAALLPNTQAEADLIAGGLGIERSKITVVPNGVEARFLQADANIFRNRYNLDGFVLNVGHIGPLRKNVLRLIHALEKINIPSVIIGRIEDNEYGQRCLAEAKNNPRLLILDAVANESGLLASAYAACSVFALPSLYETPGIAALEAGLAGANIVVTKHGGTKEYFGTHAEYVEPTSVELIHHGIVTALNKPKDPALRDRIAKEYLWERVAEKTRDIYQRVLSSA